MEYTKYTVFRNDEGVICFLAVEAYSVENLMQRVHSFYGGWGALQLLAWAPEWPIERGGRLECDDLCAESIAAGRLIEKTASGWVALGAEKQEDEKRHDIECALQYAQAELRKVKPTSADLAMIARDGPAKPIMPVIFGIDYAAGCAPSTAKPNPFPAFRNPDACNGPSDHLNASRHQMAGMKG